MRRTKIVATLGPACDSVDIMVELIRAGVDVARVNLSHGEWPLHQQRIRLARQAAMRLGKEIGIMLDTQGPEVRLGPLRTTLHLDIGDMFYLGREGSESDKILTVTWPGLFDMLKVGQTLWIDDGRLVVEVQSVASDVISLVAKNRGDVDSQKKLSLPGYGWPLDPLTEKDRDALVRGITEEGIDFVALSFVRSADDILTVRRFLEDHHISTFLMAKIENPLGMDHLDEILRVSDGVMDARGDLGVELPEEDVPELQKTIIRQANLMGRPVVTATQMLESMVDEERPTRAEATDVANAIWDGTDAVMLSAETAVGQHPVGTVAMMAKIAERADAHPEYAHRVQFRTDRIADAVSRASAEIAEQLHAGAILTVTESGYTARMVSRCKPEVPIIAISPHQTTLRQLTLYWGVEALAMGAALHTDDMVDQAIDIAREAHKVADGDVVVVTAGVPAGTPGTTNLVRVETISDLILKGQGLGTNMSPVTGPVLIVKENAVAPQTPFVAVVQGYDPQWVSILDHAKAIVASDAGWTSDIAVYALSRQIPAVVGVHDVQKQLSNGQTVTVDPVRGVVYFGKTRV
ncbi:MAG: pyruvate kinase [Sulfobacillus sp.]